MYPQKTTRKAPNITMGSMGTSFFVLEQGYPMGVTEYVVRLIVMSKKLYNAFSDELKRTFGCRVHRISVDAGFTCPNRDGYIGTGGCIYCEGEGSGSFGIARGLSVTEQLEEGKEVMVRKYKARKFIAYFQAFSNTYAPLERLASLY